MVRVILMNNGVMLHEMLSTGQESCKNLLDMETLEGEERERVRVAVRGGEEMHSLLNDLHNRVRTEVWRARKREEVRMAVERVSPDARAEAKRVVLASTNPFYICTFNQIIRILGVSQHLDPEAVIEWVKE